MPVTVFPYSRFQLSTEGDCKSYECFPIPGRELSGRQILEREEKMGSVLIW